MAWRNNLQLIIFYGILNQLDCFNSNCRQKCHSYAFYKFYPLLRIASDTFCLGNQPCSKWPKIFSISPWVKWNVLGVQVGLSTTQQIFEAYLTWQNQLAEFRKIFILSKTNNFPMKNVRRTHNKDTNTAGNMQKFRQKPYWRSVVDQILFCSNLAVLHAIAFRLRHGNMLCSRILQFSGT